MDEIVAAARSANAHDFILEMPEGYDTVVGERGYTLSGGQRQRISIARTLLVNPPILVLDDATSAIDVQIEQQIHEALRGLMVDRTTLIIAHRLSTISLADRVAVVEGGRVIAEGTHADLLATEPRYAEILAQSDVETDDDEGPDLVPGLAPDLDAVVADDVSRSRVLDADIGEMRDED
jgi:ATP-binding cassette subfamily B protein